MSESPSQPSSPLRLSVLVGCYGNWPGYSLRAVESLIHHSTFRERLDIYVGCNESSAEILAVLRQHLDAGRIHALVESRRNINKDPMMRVLLDLCETEYMLWLDDDSHVQPGWDEHLFRFIETQRPFDVAGHVFFISNRSPDYANFLRTRPWYVSREREVEPIWFATGGLFMARAAWLRRHDFPDRAMVKKQDDILLGDLLQQQGGVLKDFATAPGLQERIRISDGQRRGSGEGSDGWRVATG
jgi:Glycosyl transferase family 2